MTCGELRTPTKDLVCSPMELVESGGQKRLNVVWYIQKHILPPLKRMLELVGANPEAWWVHARGRGGGR